MKLQVSMPMFNTSILKKNKTDNSFSLNSTLNSTLNRDLVSFSSKNKPLTAPNSVSFGHQNDKNQTPSIVAMAPLEMKTPEEWKQFKDQLKIAKQNGVKAISVDVWWGKVEGEKDQKFDWTYYDKVFETIKEHDLHIVPIMSFHKCGGNVGDNVNVPVPEWSWKDLSNKLGKTCDSDSSQKLPHNKKQELEYTNEQGKHSSDVIPVWYDDKVKDQYKDFMVAFKKHFIDENDFSSEIDEINISLGPSGELRYPSYGNDKVLGSNASYPNRGNFNCYDEGGINAFRQHIKTKYKTVENLNNEWDTKLKSFDEVRPPSESDEKGGKASNFVANHAYENTKYGKDFIGWYNNELVKHETLMLNMAHDVLEDCPSNIAIGIKIPGIHWNMGIDKIGQGSNNVQNPRISEMTAGLISTDQDYNKEQTSYGYNKILDALKKVKDSHPFRDTSLHFTCLEMSDNREGSLAKKLVQLVLRGAKDRDLTIKGENALADLLPYQGNWNQIKDAFSKHVNGNNGQSYDGITFLRVSDLAKNDVLPKFQDFMASISQKNKVQN